MHFKFKDIFAVSDLLKCVFLDETDELVIPGNKKEINDFIEFASKQSRIHVDLVLPKATLSVPSKHFYELLYNR
jgi:hypothetical protein